MLKALPLLPEPERFEALAVEACRSNVLTVFEAIACENPYPQRYFVELPWNQMVLKAAFNGVALTRIVGLDERLEPRTRPHGRGLRRRTPRGRQTGPRRSRARHEGASS